MSNFTMKIRNVKNIKKLDFDIPTEKGLYALTGENGSGKSTIIASAASSFYVPWLYDYFGEPRETSKITFDLDGKRREIVAKENKSWSTPKEHIDINGCYEGSIVYGNRFRNSDYELVNKISRVSSEQLRPASEFVRKQLGLILRDDEDYYDEKLFTLKRELKLTFAKKYKIKTDLFYFSNQGSLVSQLQMSTGENLLLTVLRSLELRTNKKNDSKYPTYVYLDEIELALHPAAIHRFILFLEELVEKFNLIVFFSTHSSDILRRITPDNIFYVQNMLGGEVKLLNPCYPAFATRKLEAANYGYDFLIFVEDYLAQHIIEKVLKEQRLLSQRKILVLPIGGWKQVLKFASDIIHSHLAPASTKILIVLDGDIKEQVPSFIEEAELRFSRPPQYLPVPSLEKYLLHNLYENLDYDLMNELNDYIFQITSVEDIINNYKKNIKSGEYTKSNGKLNSGVNSGKNLYFLFNTELKKQRKTEKELVDCITEYLFRTNDKNLQKLNDFFREQLSK